MANAVAEREQLDDVKLYRQVDRHEENVAVEAAEPAKELSSRRLIVADSGASWIDDLFAEAARQAAPTDSQGGESLQRWLHYKRRSVSLAPQNWLAFYYGDTPVGLAQGAGVVRVFHTHFFYLRPGFQQEAVAHGALGQLQDLAVRRRCSAISFEGARTGAVLKTLGARRLVSAGFTPHERVHLCRDLTGERSGSPCCDGFQVHPLALLPEDVSRLMALETEAFQHAECDHPGELPSDFSDGYRTTLIPMAPLSAVARDAEGTIRGALYAEAQGNTAWIHTLFVEPAWRHQKIATALLEHCLQVHREAGYTATELMVLAANFPAMRLYEGAGFQELKRVDLFIKKI